MELTKDSPMTREEIQRILESPIPYNNEKEKELAMALVETLTLEQVELAAQGSYAYWLATRSDQPPTDDERRRMAIREARRFLGNPYDVAEKNLKKACEFRKERRIDLIRASFTNGIFEFESQNDANEVEKLKRHISNDVQKQNAFVRGRDKEGCAVLIVRSRTEKDTDDDEFVLSHIYIVERAIASTEFASEGKEEKITVVLDFGSFKASLAPSLGAVKTVCSILENMYSDRLKKLVIVDPPLWMRTMYGLLKPFLDPVTRAKFVVASGSKRKQHIISKVIDEDQAMPFMLPNGKLSDKVNIKRFLHDVPFHHGYY